MKYNKLVKRALCLGLAGTMVIGSVTTSFAADEKTENGIVVDDGTSVDTGDDLDEEVLVQAEGITSADVNAALDNAEKEAGDVVVSVVFGDVVIDEATAIINENKAENGVNAAEGTIEEAADKIDDAGLLNQDKTDENGDVVVDEAGNTIVETGKTEQDIADANAAMDTAETTTDAATEAFNKTVADAAEKIEAGFTTSADAQTTINDLTAAQTTAQAEYDKAAADLVTANDELTAALENYDAAAKISADAAAKAEEQLNLAKQQLQTATDAAKAANDKVVKVKDVLDSALKTIGDWKENTQDALDKVNEDLAASKEELADSIENLKTENTEFKEAVGEFETQFGDLTDAVKDFADSISNAKDAKDKYDELLALHDDAVAAYEAAVAVGITEPTQEETEELARLESAKVELDNALAAAEALKTSFETNETLYQNSKDTLANADASEEEKERAAHELAQLAITLQLIPEMKYETATRVEWVAPGVASKYGKSEDGFFVVIAVDDNGNDGEILGRYGYTTVYEDENDNTTGKVEVVEVTTFTEYYVTYKGQEYKVNVAGEGDNKEYSISVEGAVVYYDSDNDECFVKESVQSAQDASTYYKLISISCPDEYKLIEESGKRFLLINSERYEIKHHKSEFKDWFEYDYVEIGLLGKCALGTSSEKTITYITYNGKKYELTDNHITLDDDAKTQVQINGDATTGYTYNVYGNNEEILTNGTTTDKITSSHDEAANAAVDNFKTTSAAQSAAAQKYEGYKADYDERNKIYNDYKAYDLGGLETLPQITDMLPSISNIDDLKNITTKLSSEEVQAALATLQKQESGDFIADLALKIEKGFALTTLLSVFKTDGESDAKYAEILATLSKPSSYQKEFFEAWIDLQMSELNVAISGMNLLTETHKTVLAGLEVINTGADLGDATIDTAIAAVKTGMLQGTAGALTIAGSTLNIAELLVTALDNKVTALQTQTQEAYDAAFAAQEALNQLTLENAKAEELTAAASALKDAQDRYNTLSGELKDAQDALADANTYKEAAQTQYDSLYAAEQAAANRPAGGTTEPTTTTPATTGAVTVAAALTADEVAEEVVTFLQDTTVATTGRRPATVVADNAQDEAVIADEETPLAAGDETAKDESVADTAEIADEETPLAAAETQMNLWWLWLLIAAAVTCGGFGGYKYYASRKTTVKSAKDATKEK